MISSINKQNVLIKTKKNLNNFFKIPKKYQQWSQIFENDETKTILLQHKPWDHETLLKLNKISV